MSEKDLLAELQAYGVTINPSRKSAKLSSTIEYRRLHLLLLQEILLELRKLNQEKS